MDHAARGQEKEIYDGGGRRKDNALVNPVPGETIRPPNSAYEVKVGFQPNPTRVAQFIKESPRAARLIVDGSAKIPIPQATRKRVQF